MASKKVQALIQEFALIGIEALYGGSKGNGFWLYQMNGELGNRTIKDPENKSGNECFWLMKDAIALLKNIK